MAHRKIDSRPESAIKVEPDKLKVVASFYYLSDILSVGRGCEVAVSIHDQTACETCHVTRAELLRVGGAPSSMAVELGR